MEFSKSSAKRKVHSKVLSQETREISNSLTLHLEELEKKEQKNPKLVEGNK